MLLSWRLLMKHLQTYRSWSFCSHISSLECNAPWNYGRILGWDIKLWVVLYQLKQFNLVFHLALGHEKYLQPLNSINQRADFRSLPLGTTLTLVSSNLWELLLLTLCLFIISVKSRSLGRELSVKINHSCLTCMPATCPVSKFNLFETFLSTSSFWLCLFWRNTWASFLGRHTCLHRKQGA